MKVTQWLINSIQFDRKLIDLCVHCFLAPEHEKLCSHPKKTGAEVMQALQATDAEINEEKKLFSTLIELLSYEKIIFNGKSKKICHGRP